MTCDRCSQPAHIEAQVHIVVGATEVRTSLCTSCTEGFRWFVHGRAVPAAASRIVPIDDPAGWDMLPVEILDDDHQLDRFREAS